MLTTAEKSAIIAVWTREDFRGTRADARRMALAGMAQTADMFAGQEFDLTDNTDEQFEGDHPGQLYLFGGIE